MLGKQRLDAYDDWAFGVPDKIASAEIADAHRKLAKRKKESFVPFYEASDDQDLWDSVHYGHENDIPF